MFIQGMNMHGVDKVGKFDGRLVIVYIITYMKKKRASDWLEMSAFLCNANTNL